jgi:hypothetical protein
MKTNIHFAQFSVEYEITKVVEKTEPLIIYPVFFLRKSYRLWDNVEKLP